MVSDDELIARWHAGDSLSQEDQGRMDTLMEQEIQRNRSAAQRAADARYEEKRRGKSRPGARVLLTLTSRQAAALDAKCLAGETRQDAIKRLACITGSDPS